MSPGIVSKEMRARISHTPLPASSHTVSSSVHTGNPGTRQVLLSSAEQKGRVWFLSRLLLVAPKVQLARISRPLNSSSTKLLVKKE